MGEEQSEPRWSETGVYPLSPVVLAICELTGV